jgi:hypothetical protein
VRNHHCGRRATEVDVTVIAISKWESNLGGRFVQSGSDVARDDTGREGLSASWKAPELGAVPGKTRRTESQGGRQETWTMAELGSYPAIERAGWL